MSMQRSEPWLVETAISFIDVYLQSIDKPVVFEYGCGSSTIWFGMKSDKIYSVEHDIKWYNEVKENTLVKVRELYNRLHLTFHERPYDKVIDEHNDESFDLILIDGRDRVKCINRSICKLKRGGLLVFDNSERKEYKNGIEIVKDWNQIHCQQNRPDKYDFTYPGWTTSIFIKP